MPSDAHELAARLRNHFAPATRPRHKDGDQCDVCVAWSAAVELERLAGRCEELERYAAHRVACPRLVGATVLSGLGSTHYHCTCGLDALLASAGPPQEAGDCICGEINARHCPVHNDPPPERRCTCQRVMLMGREIARPRDPACPVHGR